MIDPDLKTELDQLNKNLTEINKKASKTGIWRSFFNGMFGALGYIAGIAIIIVVLTWFLQKTGLLKPFQDEMNNFADVIGAAKKLITSDPNSPADAVKPNQAATGTPTIVTLPNGQQIKVLIPQ
jgi:hypothetical protein